MKVNGESIYGTSASPLKAQPAWGRVTKKGDKLYLHVFDWPKDGKLVLEGMVSEPKEIHLLADSKQKLGIAASGWTGYEGNIMIDLPPQPLDPIDTVVVLTL